MSTNPIVQITGGAVALAGRPILRDIDLQVQPGEVVAILGANGSGKSTLVKTLVGLLPLAAGSVRLFGEPLEQFTSWRRLGYVPQRSTITQGVPATVREVVAAGRLARRRVFAPARAADRRAVLDALATVGLADRADQQVATLSGGQQQRVLMARTLAGEPDLLVLDEPNAGVDLISQQAIADAMATLAGRGATIIVVLHELGPFAPLIDRAIALREGRVCYDGPPSQLDAAGRIEHADHCEPGERAYPVPPMTGLIGEDR